MFAMALYLAVLGLMPRHLGTSGHASKKIGRLLPIRGMLTHKRSNLHASPTGELAGLDGAQGCPT